MKYFAGVSLFRSIYILYIISTKHSNFQFNSIGIIVIVCIWNIAPYDRIHTEFYSNLVLYSPIAGLRLSVLFVCYFLFDLVTNCESEFSLWLTQSPNAPPSTHTHLLVSISPEIEIKSMAIVARRGNGIKENVRVSFVSGPFYSYYIFFIFPFSISKITLKTSFVRLGKYGF